MSTSSGEHRPPPRALGAELPPIRPEEGAAFAALLGLVRRLRAPGGCPWDREQTLRTMTPYIIEEAYEVMDAIERDDSPGLREELGDLIFLLLFCAEVGREEGRFAVDEILDHHLRKMIGRHPHVFGAAGRLAAGAAAQQWEELKQAEGGGERRSVVDGRIPALPALTAAYRVQEKAAAVGFDWEDLRGVLDKIEEEVAELRAELDRARATADGTGDAPAPGDPRRAELGDLLFAMVNLARRLRIDPESALRATTARFMRRFRYIEERLAEAGTRPSQASLAEMDRLWEEAKARERAETREQNAASDPPGSPGPAGGTS